MAMQLTPSAKSSFLAGFALALVAWASFMKVHRIPLIKRFINRDKVLDWVTENKALTLVGTEVVNFGIHGVSNPNSTTFALGSTVFNSLMIFVMLPMRKWYGKEEALTNQRISTIPMAGRKLGKSA